MLLRFLGCVLTFLLSAGGCVSRAPSRFDGLTPQQARALASQMSLTRSTELHADLASAFKTRAPRNILILSGGDAHGAFGCGVLSGWRQNAASPRPSFDLVTGISTGALMATFAFLGESGDDATLKNVYTHARDGDIFAGPVGGPPDAVLDTAPLHDLIAKVISPETIRRVAAAHRAGRRLYVATVELDSGALVTWPMSRLASDAVSSDGSVDEAMSKKFRDILLAAASIPVLFPPVEIDGGLHADAGLRQAVLLDPAMLDGGPGTAPHPPVVWLLFNGQLGFTPEPVDADLVDIGTRSLTIYTHAVELLGVREIAYMAAAHDPPAAFHWAAESMASPPDPVAPGLFEPMFDPKTTAARYQAGERSARDGKTWNAGPPPP